MSNDIETMTAAIEQMNEDGTYTTQIPAEAYAVYADNQGYLLDEFTDWADEAEEAYQGDYTDDVEFAQELADGIGATPNSDAGWPLTYIDWDAAARDLMYDYFSVNGYYFRNI